MSSPPFAQLCSASSSSTSIPVSDCFVTDLNFDGIGDVVWRLGGLIVGFNWDDGGGEQRAIYEFSLAPIPRGSLILSATLLLNLAGSYAAPVDPNVTLYSAAGDGVASANDFAASRYVASFNVYNSPISIPITPAVQELISAGAGHVAFVIRPNPVDRAQQGGWNFSTIETGHSPPKLTIVYDASVSATHASWGHIKARWR